MRCPDCNKFVSYDTEAEPDANLEVSDEGQLTGYVVRNLPCGECGTDLKTYQFDVDEDLNALVKPQPGTTPRPNDGCLGDKHDWLWADVEEDPSVSTTERLNDTDRKGNKIKARRFMTQLYGIEISGEVVCGSCGIKGVWTVEAEESASAFDEQV